MQFPKIFVNVSKVWLRKMTADFTHPDHFKLDAVDFLVVFVGL